MADSTRQLQQAAAQPFGWARLTQGQREAMEQVTARRTCSSCCLREQASRRSIRSRCCCSTVAAGVMIALGLVPALALAAMALVAGDTDLLLLSLGRWPVDASIVTATSAAVFVWHRKHDGRAATG